MKHPFDIKLTRKGKFRFSKNLKDKEEKTVRINENQESEAATERSATEKAPTEVSTVPSSLRSTPRGNPLRDLSKVDFTLSSQIDHAEIKETIIQLLTNLQTQQAQQGAEGDDEDEYAEEEFPANWKLFPKFGFSPSRTPVNVTPPILSPHQIPEPPKVETPKKVRTQLKYNHTVFFFS
jgi:hypothetical protein